MKIVMIGNNAGGMYNFRGNLIKELQKQGHDVCLVVPDDKRDLKRDKIFELGAKVILMNMQRRKTNPIQDLKVVFQYISILHQEKPDIVLTYTIKPNAYGGIACQLVRVPYIANITGLGTAVENGGILQKITLFLYKLGLKKAKKVFFQNKSNCDFMLNHGIVNDRYELIPGSGVDTNKNEYSDYPIDDGTIKFLFIGRVMKDKGISEYLDCAEYFHNNYPNTQFGILGGFDDVAYEQRVNSLHNDKIINYYGYQEDVPSFIKSHHVLIQPSYHEGLSNVLLEAASTGRPVIASDIPGCRETFDEGISGLGFIVKDSQSLIEVTERFYHLPYEDKRQMGINGRKKVEREFDRKIVVSKYIETIENIVK